MSSLSEDALWLIPLPVVLLRVSGDNPLDFEVAWHNPAAEQLLEQPISRGLELRDNVFLGDKFWQIAARSLRGRERARITDMIYSSPGGQEHALSLDIYPLRSDILLLVATHGEEEHHISYYDGQTALLRRESFLDFAEAELRVQQKRGYPSALLLGDIDKFKEFNDREGHARGDEVLSEVGLAIGSAIRRDDIAGRIGGDEFAALLPGAGPERACEAAESALRKLRSSGILLSVGIAIDRGSSLEELLQAADSLMYEAKRLGGDSYQIKSM